MSDNEQLGGGMEKSEIMNFSGGIERSENKDFGDKMEMSEKRDFRWDGNQRKYRLWR